MTKTHVLVLHGSPGSGKSTLANEIAELLREQDLSHALIDVDELARIYPESGNDFQWKNLAAIWPQYSVFPKVILPVLIDTLADLEALRAAVSGSEVTVCALTAAEATLKRRVTAREPNDYWQSKLRALVDKYLQNNTIAAGATVSVDTDNRPVRQTASEILSNVGWIAKPE